MHPRWSLTALVVALALVLVAAPAASAAGACRAANASIATASKRALVRATLCQLNVDRARAGLRPLRLNRRLSAAARRHSRAMARRHFFSHNSLNGSSFLDRIRRTGYLRGARSWTVGENIAYGSGRLSTPRSIGRAWMNSPGHRANILSSSFRAIGIGIAAGTPSGGGGATYTTDFGRRG
ncbi:MAG TPA: CAP domain-containing protein [Thermoleophilaceae bacterium]